MALSTSLILSVVMHLNPQCLAIQCLVSGILLTPHFSSLSGNLSGKKNSKHSILQDRSLAAVTSLADEHGQNLCPDGRRAHEEERTS
jgi:hypothetical protein